MCALAFAMVLVMPTTEACTAVATEVSMLRGLLDKQTDLCSSVVELRSRVSSATR